MAPKCKSSDTGSSDMPERSYEVLPLSEKVKVPDLLRKEKKYADVAKIYSKNGFFLPMKLWGRKKKFVLILLSYLKVQKLWPQNVIRA